MKKVINYLFNENPVFVTVLGLCSTLAVTNTFERSYMMGIVVLLILVLSNVVVSILRKIVNDEIRIPVYIIIISTLVTVVELLLKKYSTSLYDAFGIYLPLVVVNCIILGRALSYASKNKVLDSFKDGLKTGLSYLTAISMIGFLREILGNGTLTIMNEISTFTGYKEVIHIFNGNMLPNHLFLTSGGAFILLGFLIAFINNLRKKESK